MTAIALMSPARVQRARAGRRRAVVIGVLALAVVALFVISILVGGKHDLAGVVGGVLGTGKKSTVFVVRELLLPRALAAVLIGLALGISGTLFQRVLGNPLASPDFLGVAAGAGTTTVAALVLGGASGIALPLSAVVGASVSAFLIAALAWKGGLTGYRFILVGIGVAAFAHSVTNYLVARAEFKDARAALTWLVGSVGFTSELGLWLLVIVLAAFVPTGILISRRLRLLELGDDTARALGSRVQLDRVLVIGVAVVLVAAATAAAGPISFVAMLAGPISVLMLGTAGRSIIAAALTGAVILQLSDLAAQHALPWPVSTGIITGLVGAPYLAWVLIRAGRSSTA